MLDIPSKLLDIRCSCCRQRVHYDGRKQWCLCNIGPVFNKNLEYEVDHDPYKWLWP
jgi:hypothetical protein